jgi:glycosyltransferase involved in cell wall biosynthesis
MAAGLPVLTSEALPFARIVRQTDAGVVFESGNALALADAGEQLTNADVRERYGANGRRAIREEYNWERDLQGLLRAVELAAGHGRHGH